MKDLYWDVLDWKEIERINKLEWIDEYEEFNLMCGHYFVSVAVKGNTEGVRKISFELLK